MVWHTHFFDSLLYEFVEISKNEQAGPSGGDGVNSTHCWIVLTEWGRLFAAPSTLRLLTTCNSGSLWRQRCCSGVLEGRNLGEELVIQVIHFLPFTVCVFSNFLRSPSFIVRQSLLLCQYLLHVSRHLEELGFVS